ncbi:arsenate reductase (glutaredoxin) [Idiomarina tyrosinivorans]|uniref:Arsenate reductase n=1 Tax=Idiomarina tyrosinivorans TaxID=1445662 RepID=A0A432ZUA4_9GAMM|nr:arsenate reductase (glutaredoxin) [Idiomarina tyrosinivorans]RUO81469.1 arsenate reductase (glutaredoxin) [Idiomarina tyrosinivorans]
MNQVVIYHNPRCSKSRQTLALLEKKGIQPEVVEYLKTPLDESQIRALLAKLDRSASEIVRRKEAEYKEAGLTADSSEQQLISAIASYPKLLERPIVVNGDKAEVGRPPEAVLNIL